MKLGRKAQKHIVALNRAGSLRRSTLTVRWKRRELKFLHRSWAIFMLFGVHPLLRGLLLEMRIGVWVRYKFREGPVVLHIWDAWAMGALMDALLVGMANYPRQGNIVERFRLVQVCGGRYRSASLLTGAALSSSVASQLSPTQ